MPGRKSGIQGREKNIFGRELKRLRAARSMTIPQMIAKLQRQGWDVGEDTITNIELGRRILSDSELVLILRVLDAGLGDLKIPFNR